MCNETRQKVSRAILAWLLIEAAILAENQKGVHSEDSDEGMANIAKVDLWNMIRKVHGTRDEQWLVLQAPRWSISGALQLSESSDGHFSFSNARNVEILVSISTADHNQAMVLVPKKLDESLLRSQPFQGKKESFSKFEVHFVFYFRLSAFGPMPITCATRLLVQATHQRNKHELSSTLATMAHAEHKKLRSLSSIQPFSVICCASQPGKRKTTQPVLRAVVEDNKIPTTSRGSVGASHPLGATRSCDYDVD